MLGILTMLSQMMANHCLCAGFARVHTSSPTDSRALSLDRVRWRRSKVYGRMGADEKDIGYVSTLHNLAFSSQAAGDLRRAIPLYHDVVRLWKQTVGPKHIAYATSMLNLAVAANIFIL